MVWWPPAVENSATETWSTTNNKLWKCKKSTQWEQLHPTGATAILPEEFVMGGSTVCLKTTYKLVRWATDVDHCTCWVVLSMDRQTHHLTHIRTWIGHAFWRSCMTMRSYTKDVFFELQIHKPYMIQEKEEEKNCFNVSIIIFLLPTPIIKLHTNIKYNVVPQLNSSVILEQLQNSCKVTVTLQGERWKGG